jgi:sugar fermentation stimulation protein A
LSAYTKITPEFTWGDSRFDFSLSDPAGKLPQCLVEVKSTTLAYGSHCMFPDAQTARGRKHLEGLIAARAAGLRAVQFYCVSRSDVEKFSPADHIDKAYGETLRRAASAGVEILCWAIDVRADQDRHDVRLSRAIAIDLETSIR